MNPNNPTQLDPREQSPLEQPISSEGPQQEELTNEETDWEMTGDDEVETEEARDLTDDED